MDELALTNEIQKAGDEARTLVDFLAELNMGEFYAGQIRSLVQLAPLVFVGGSERPFEETVKTHLDAYRDKLAGSRDRVYELVVELLRFQDWHGKPM